MEFVVNYIREGQSVTKIAMDELSVNAMVNNATTEGVKFISTIALVPKEEDEGQFRKDWQSNGKTFYKRAWYNVYSQFIKTNY